jgi:hypothetical protein
VLPRSLTGTTIIAGEKDYFTAITARAPGDGLRRVRLENPGFERRFTVHGSDPIEARALLTPAFMERFLALGDGDAAGRPGAWAEGNRLIVALPKRNNANLFEPPSFWKPVEGNALVRLHDDIAAVLRMADAVIELDFWARGRAAGPGQPGAPPSATAD